MPLNLRRSIFCFVPLAVLVAACNEAPTTAPLNSVWTTPASTHAGDIDDDGVPDGTDIEPTLSNKYHYVDWTAANPGAGTASGTIALPGGRTIGVQFRVLNPNGSNGSYYFAQTSGGTPWWAQRPPNPLPYISAYVLNPPPLTDIIALIGGNTNSYVITFSEAVQDPVMDILSLGSGGDDAIYDFDRPFEIVSQGVGYWGGCSTCLQVRPGEQLRGTEGHGTIRFIGSFPTFSWSVPNGEAWHAFTLAIRGPADPNVDHDGDGLPDATDNCPLVANAGQGDSDFDGVGDACDAVNDGNVDTDGDGLTNAEEHAIGTSPTNPDTDGDGLNDKIDPNPLGDRSPPVITPTVSGTGGNNGWYTSNVTVSWTVVDNESAIGSQTDCTTSSVTTDTNGQTFSCTATSAGGSSTRSVTIKRDATAPSVVGSQAGTQGSNGWYTSNVAISFTVTDGTSGIASTMGCDAASLTADTPGQTITCTATDNAGNSASDSESAKRDATPPTVIGSQSGSDGANGWYVSDAIISFTVSDATSGIASSTPACAGTTISTDTPGASVTCTATDNAGNSASDSESVKRDATAPSVALVGNAGSYTVDQTVSITCTASDATSGLAAPCTGGTSGAAYTYALGANIVSASATDNAGNTGSVSGTFTVSVTSGSLCNLVRQWVSQHGVANSMCQQLANGAYGAFRNHVKAQSGKFVSAAHASILISLSNSL